MQKFMQEAKVNSGCFTFILFSSKCAIIKLNCRAYLAAYIRKYSNNLWILVARISIKKTVQLFTMSMKVENEPDLSLFA